MTKHRLEVADVFREYGLQFLAQYGNSLSIDQKRTFRAIQDCRTAALGGHLYECDHCRHQLVLYNSCGNRHCPKCQAMGGAKWMEARASELLPIPYLHVVFTLPQETAAIALQNRRVVTVSSSMLPQRRSKSWLPIPSTLVPRSVCCLSSTLGGRH